MTKNTFSLWHDNELGIENIFSEKFVFIVERSETNHPNFYETPRRHDRFWEEPYIFARAKIVILQILKNYNIKTIFHKKRFHFKDFQGCMYVRMHVIK